MDNIFRFSIRELCLIMVVCSLGLAWWLDHHRLSLVATHWRNRAGALNWIMSMEGWKTEWWEDRVFAEKEGPGAYDAPTDIYAPTWPKIP